MDVENELIVRLKINETEKNGKKVLEPQSNCYWYSLKNTNSSLHNL